MATVGQTWVELAKAGQGPTPARFGKSRPEPALAGHGRPSPAVIRPTQTLAGQGSPIPTRAGQRWPVPVLTRTGQGGPELAKAVHNPSGFFRIWRSGRKRQLGDCQNFEIGALGLDLFGNVEFFESVVLGRWS